MQQIAPDFKMKICHTIIMLTNILPYAVGIRVVAVKGAVHKFHLRHLVFKKEIKLSLCLFRAFYPHRFLNGG